MRLPTIQGTPMLPPDAYLLDVAAKPWWQSRTVWSGVITVGASVGALFGIAIPHELTLGIVMSIVSGLSGAGAIYGRVKAARPIRTTRKIGPDEHESMFIGGLD